MQAAGVSAYDPVIRRSARTPGTPKVAARVGLYEASRAHQLMETGGHAGKVVLITS